MALTNKLTAIADAIRGKTGKTEEMTLDQMATEIAGIVAGGGGISPTITVETVIAAASGTTGDVVHNYVKTLFPTLDSAEPFLFKVLIVKDVETAKQTNNGFLGIFAYYGASKIPYVHNYMLRWRDKQYSTVGTSSAFDLVLTSGTEFYMVTIDMKGVWA